MRRLVEPRPSRGGNDRGSGRSPIWGEEGLSTPCDSRVAKSVDRGLEQKHVAHEPRRASRTNMLVDVLDRRRRVRIGHHSDAGDAARGTGRQLLPRRRPRGRCVRRARNGLRGVGSGSWCSWRSTATTPSRSGAEHGSADRGAASRDRAVLRRARGRELIGELVCYARSVAGVQWDRMEDGYAGRGAQPLGGGDVPDVCGPSSRGRPTEQSAYDTWLEPDGRPARRPATIASTEPSA